MDLLMPHLGLIFWTLLAFLLVLFVLKKFAWGLIIKGLNEREKGIAESISTAERVRAEMAQLKNDNEALLASAREERSLMLREAKEIRDKMVSDAKDEAKVQAAKIIADAHASIENQKMAALTDMKNEVGKMVVEFSEKVLRKELGNKAEHENYIKQLANDIHFN